MAKVTVGADGSMRIENVQHIQGLGDRAQAVEFSGVHLDFLLEGLRYFVKTRGGLPKEHRAADGELVRTQGGGSDQAPLFMVQSRSASDRSQGTVWLKMDEAADVVLPAVQRARGEG